MENKQSKGGFARAEKLSPEERSRIASIAAKARWTGKTPETKCVYIIAPEVGPVKIGVSVRPRMRRTELQGGSPFRLDLVSAFSEGIDDAEAVEKIAHEILHQHRLSGEWFDITRDQAQEAVATAILLVAKGEEVDTFTGPGMSPKEFLSYVKRAGMNLDEAAKWLGVGRATAWRYAQIGPSKAAGIAVKMRAEILELEADANGMVRLTYEDLEKMSGLDKVRHSDLTAAVGLPEAWKAGDKLTWCDESFVFSHYDPAYPRAMCVSDVDGRTVAINITSAAAVGVGS